MWKTRIPYRLIDFSSRIHPIGDWVIGVRRISDSGGAGSWTWIDENDNAVEVEDGYFRHHPSYQFEEVDLQGNDMVSIPKFYVKSDSSGRYWISPTPREGFHVHPAFMSKGKAIKFEVTETNGVVTDQASIMIGKWQSWIDYGKMLSPTVKMWSMPSWPESRIDALQARQRQAWIDEHPDATPEEIDEEVAKILITEKQRVILRDVYPSVNATYWENWHAADAWNDHLEDGPLNVVGFHMMNVWEWSALQWLALIEGKTTDVQSKFGMGHIDGSGLDTVDGDFNCTSNFHGIMGLWGNVWQWIQGVQTYYNGTIFVWDNIGNSVWKDTGKLAPLRSGDYELWSRGENCGYWKERINASGYNYDTSDMFIPDVNSLVSDYARGSFSDGVWGRTRSASKDLYACAVGGSYDSGQWGGMFGWNFNVRLGKEVVKDGILQEEVSWSYDNVASRLCFAPVNISGDYDDDSNG